MNSKSRQNSNTSNRLSVANRTELLTKTGTREGEMVLQADIGLSYTWSATQGTDNSGTIINVGAGSWIASYSGAVNCSWFGDTSLEATFKKASDVSQSVEVDVGTYSLDGNTIDFTGIKFHSFGITMVNINTSLTVLNLVP